VGKDGPEFIAPPILLGDQFVPVGLPEIARDPDVRVPAAELFGDAVAHAEEDHPEAARRAGAQRDGPEGRGARLQAAADRLDDQSEKHYGFSSSAFLHGNPGMLQYHFPFTWPALSASSGIPQTAHFTVTR